MEQFLLFDIHPEGTEPPIAQRVITPGCLLPLPANQIVDVARVGKILGVEYNTVLNIIRLGSLEGYRLSAQKKLRYNISYASVVEYCDKLRVEFTIRDRRPKLAPGRRWRDTDLLPFPMSDTVTVKEVMIGLDLTKLSALRLIEEGRFEAYRLSPQAPWRVSKTSLFDYAARLKQSLASAHLRRKG